MKCPICGKKMKNGYCKNCGLDLTGQVNGAGAQYYMQDPYNPNVSYAMQETGQSQPISSVPGLEPSATGSSTATPTAKKKNGWYALAGILCVLYGLLPSIVTYLLAEFNLDLALESLVQMPALAYISLGLLLMIKASHSSKLLNLAVIANVLFNASTWLGYLLQVLPSVLANLYAWEVYCMALMYALPMVEGIIIILGICCPKFFAKISKFAATLTTLQLIASVVTYWLSDAGVVLMVCNIISAVVFWAYTITLGKGIRADAKI